MPHDARQTKISTFFTSNTSTANKTDPKPQNAAIELQSTTRSAPAITEGSYEQLQEDKDDFRSNRLSRSEIHIVHSSGESSYPEDAAPEPTTEPNAISKHPAEEPFEDISCNDTTVDSQTPPSNSNQNASTDPRYTIQRLSATDLTPFKRLLNTLLPVNYPPSFFTSIQQTDSAFARIAMWHHKPGLSGPMVGGIKCRLEHVPPLPGPDGKPVKESQLYIQAIGVLAPYRRFGIAGALLENVLAEARELKGSELEEMGRVRSVYAHVWQASPDALEWYKKRGFVVEELVEEYYRRLKPHGAWLRLHMMGGRHGLYSPERKDTAT